MITAIKSAIASARNTPVMPSPPIRGRIIARGKSNITFLKSARNIDDFASPTAKNVVWQAI